MRMNSYCNMADAQAYRCKREVCDWYSLFKHAFILAVQATPCLSILVIGFPLKSLCKVLLDEFILSLMSPASCVHSLPCSTTSLLTCYVL